MFPASSGHTWRHQEIQLDFPMRSRAVEVSRKCRSVGIVWNIVKERRGQRIRFPPDEVSKSNTRRAWRTGRKGRAAGASTGNGKGIEDDRSPRRCWNRLLVVSRNDWQYLQEIKEHEKWAKYRFKKTRSPQISEAKEDAMSLNLMITACADICTSLMVILGQTVADLFDSMHMYAVFSYSVHHIRCG